MKKLCQISLQSYAEESFTVCFKLGLKKSTLRITSCIRVRDALTYYLNIGISWYWPYWLLSVYEQIKHNLHISDRYVLTPDIYFRIIITCVPQGKKREQTAKNRIYKKKSLHLEPDCYFEDHYMSRIFASLLICSVVGRIQWHCNRFLLDRFRASTVMSQWEYLGSSPATQLCFFCVEFVCSLSVCTCFLPQSKDVNKLAL